jgi:hypothetical protein
VTEEEGGGGGENTCTYKCVFLKLPEFWSPKKFVGVNYSTGKEFSL